MTGIIDYDAGNIKSVQKALEFLGEEAVVSRKPAELLAYSSIFLLNNYLGFYFYS